MSKEFLAFTYKIPSEPSKNRVYVWRMIKELGAVYLQQGVALLPYDENLYSTLINLREQVHSFGGKSTLGKLGFLEQEDEKEIIGEFTKQIDEEYGEFINNCQGLIDELEREISKGDFNFSEIMENEEDYRKYERWLEKIIKKDYFKSENQAHAIKKSWIKQRKNYRNIPMKYIEGMKMPDWSNIIQIYLKLKNYKRILKSPIILIILIGFFIV